MASLNAVIRKYGLNADLISILATFFICLLYASYFSYVDILFNVNLSDITDRQNYLTYADSYLDIFYSFYDASLLDALLNEPLFLLLNYLAGLLTADSESAVRLLIFVSSFSAAYFSVKAGNNKLLSVIIIFIPQIFVNYIMSLRQGLALAFFLVGWYSQRKSVKLLFFLMAPFIHTSFFISIIILAFNWAAKALQFSKGLQISFVVILSVFASTILLDVASVLGVRQGDLYLAADRSDFKFIGFGLIYWFLILYIFIIQRDDFYKKNNFQISAIIFYIVSYIIFPPLARTIQNHALLILLAGFELSGVSLILFRIAVVSYFGYAVTGAFSLGFMHDFIE